MNLKDLLESGADVSVTVKLDDLREIFKEVVGRPQTDPSGTAAGGVFKPKGSVICS